MIISKNHLKIFLKKDFSDEELSAALFQLGHENEIFKDLIDIEITPNRGDCLSLFGLARDLDNFFTLKKDIDLYNKDLDIYEECLCMKLSLFSPEKHRATSLRLL